MRLLQEVAHPLPDRRSPRLTDGQRLIAERLAEHPRLRCLARAIDSLECDEEAGHPGDGTSGEGGRRGVT